MHLRNGAAEQRLRPGTQVTVGVLVDVERENSCVSPTVSPSSARWTSSWAGPPARPQRPAAAATPSSSGRLVIDSFSGSMPATSTPTPRAADDHPARAAAGRDDAADTQRRERLPDGAA